MNKQQLVNEVRARTDLPEKQITATINATLDAITDELFQGRSVSLVNFGTFEVYDAAPRSGVNPRTKEKIEIPARRRARLDWSKTLQQMIADTAPKTNAETVS
jgi:DNA-binding protein HU-beta